MKAQETVYSEEYKAWVYRVPVKRLTWTRAFSEVEQEQEASKKRGAKGGDVELDLIGLPTRKVQRQRVHGACVGE